MFIKLFVNHKVVSSNTIADRVCSISALIEKVPKAAVTTALSIKTKHHKRAEKLTNVALDYTQKAVIHSNVESTANY